MTRSFHRSNMFPDGMGKSTPSAPPADLDWDMWLGPRPERPFQDNIAPYKFRWWKEYCCQISNNGVHSLDMIRWMMDAVAPTSICCMGGKFAVDDDRTIPDTAETIFQFPEGWLDLFGMYEASGYPTMARSGFVELRGTQGVLFASDKTVDIVPERGGQFQDSSSADGTDETDRNRRAPPFAHRPARPQFPGLHPVARDAQRRYRGGAPLDDHEPAVEDLVGRRPDGLSGTRKTSRSPTAPRPTTCCITNTASRGNSANEYWVAITLRGVHAAQSRR